MKIDMLEDYELTNDFFKFGIIDGNFYCDACAGLTSLEGAPEKVSTFSYGVYFLNFS